MVAKVEPKRMHVKIPKLMKYELTANIFQGQDMQPADDNGLADPYVKVSWGGVERETELRNLLLNFDKNCRMVPPGTRCAIANGDICLPPDLVHRVMHGSRPRPLSCESRSPVRCPSPRDAQLCPADRCPPLCTIRVRSCRLYRAVAARYTALSCCGSCCNKLYSRQKTQFFNPALARACVRKRVLTVDRWIENPVP